MSRREGRACRDRRGTDATSASLRRNDSGIVSAASSWARRAVCVLGGVFVGAARRGRRALPCVRHGACVVGADVPAARVAVCVLGGVPWARRAEDVAPYHVFGMVRCVVGADVPAARVPVCVLGGVPWARRAEDVAPYHVFGMVRCVRGRGRRPRRPACPCASSAASLGRGAPGTSRPTRCAHARCAHGVRVRRAVCVCGARCACADMVRCVVGADVSAARVAVGVFGGVPWTRQARPSRVSVSEKNGQKCCTKGGSGLPRPPSCEIMASTPNPKGRR